MIFRALVLFACVFMAAAAPARAGFDAAGAESLKAEIEKSLSWYSDMSAAAGQGLDIEGTVRVTPKETFYEVHVPRVTLFTDAGFRVVIGTLSLSAVPGTEEKEWLFSMAVPQRMAVYDAADTPIADISVGRQKFSGAWIAGTEVLHKHDAAYGDISVAPRAGNPFSMTLESLSSRRDLRRDADADTWSGPLSFSLRNIDVNMANAAEVALHVDAATFDETYTAAPLGQSAEMKEKIRALMSAGSAPSEEQARAFLSAMAEQSARFPDGIKSTFAISGFTAEAINGTATQRVRFQFDSLSGDNAATGMHGEKSAGHARLALKGLKTTGLPPEIAGVVPENAALEMRVRDLPAQALADMLNALLTKMSAAGETPEDRQKTSEETAAALSRMPPLLATAGTALEIGDTFIAAPDVEARLEGSLRASAASPIAVEGRLKLTLDKIDEFIGKHQALAMEKNKPQYTQVLIPVQMMGQIERREDGLSRRSYTFDFTPEGRLLLNGSDMTALQALIQAGRKDRAALPAPATPEKAE